MQLRINDLAEDDLKSYLEKSKKTSENLAKYKLSLMTAINLLLFNPKLGKVYYIMKNLEIRKLVHKEHNILYQIKNDEIIIISVVHTNYPINETLKFIKKYLEEL